MRKIQVRISPDGSKVVVDAEGFTGNSCMEATKSLLANLGNVENTRKKEEFYREEVNECYENEVA